MRLTLVRVLFFVCFIISISANSESTICYFEKQIGSVKVDKFETPICVNKFKIPENLPSDLHEKIFCVTHAPSYAHASYDSWTNFLSDELLEVIQADENEFIKTKEKYPEYLKSQPTMQYRCYLYSIEYEVENTKYAFLVYTAGSKPLLTLPKNIGDLEKDQSRGIGCKFLIYDHDRWKNHYIDKFPFKPMELWKDLSLLNSIIEAGYCYHSIAEAGLAPFDPPERLKVDSIRERYDGETLFQYPEPDARLAELRAQEPATAPPLETPHEPAHVQQTAWLIGLLIAYGLVATIGWMRK